MSGLSVEQELARRGLLALIEGIARAHHVTVAELIGRRRLSHIVKARHSAWLALRQRGWSYPAIGWLFGVDHTSVMSACRRKDSEAERAAEEVQ
jgi:chromosomal replication initiation ATPase DnaA